MDLASFSRAVLRRLRPVVVPIVRILVRRQLVRRAIRLAITPFPRLRMRLQRFAMSVATDPGPILRLVTERELGGSEPVGAEAARLGRQLERAFARRGDGGR